MLKAPASDSHDHAADEAVSRRAFVSAAAIAGAMILARHAGAQWWARPSGWAALRVRIVLVAGDDEAARSRMLGALMGVEETQHAAALFGATMEQITVRPTSPAEVPSVVRSAGGGMPAAVLGGSADVAGALMDWSAATGVPWLDTDGTASEDAAAPAATFRVTPSAATRAAALRAWLASPPAGERWTADADGARATRSDGAHAEVAAWDATLERFGADQLNERFARWANREMDEWAWSGWLATKAVWEAALRARSHAPGAIAAAMASARAQLDGHKGVQLVFDRATHELRQPLYVVTRDPAGKRLAVSNVPRPRTLGDDSIKGARNR